MVTILAIVLFCIGFILFGIMDVLAHHYDSIEIKFIKNNPQFWDKRVTWRNKWYPMLTQATKESPWVEKERFWGSSRWFVMFTDGWHLTQFFAYQFLCIAVCILITPVFLNVLLFSIAVHIIAVTIKSLTMKAL